MASASNILFRLAPSTLIFLTCRFLVFILTFVHSFTRRFAVDLETFDIDSQLYCEGRRFG